MNRLAMILTVVILPAWVLPAPASGILGLFGKKTNVNPAERVPALIVTLKTDQDERKRASAASELGKFDAAAYAEIVPVLVDVLQHDPKPAVRMDAASSLGSLKPISQLAGQALEKAVAGDDNWRVRWHAKSLLAKYRAMGYAPAKGETPGSNGPKTIEPPLFAPAVLKPQPAAQAAPPPASFPTGPAPVANTSLSRVPAAKKDDSLEFRPSIPRPLPQGPTFTTAVPQQASHSAPPPLPLVNSEGPPLSPPSQPLAGQPSTRTEPPPLAPATTTTPPSPF
jgi:hypothetical protein